MKIQDMIEALLKLQKEDPEAILCMTEDGYYSEGRYQPDIFFPIKQTEEEKGVDLTPIKTINHVN